MALDGARRRTGQFETVVEGRLQLTLKGVDMIPEPGDQVFIPRHGLHSVVNIAPTRTAGYGYDNPGVRSSHSTIFSQAARTVKPSILTLSLIHI